MYRHRLIVWMLLYLPVELIKFFRLFNFFDYETADVEDLLKRTRILQLKDVEEDPTLDARREE